MHLAIRVYELESFWEWPGVWVYPGWVDVYLFWSIFRVFTRKEAH